MTFLRPAAGLAAAAIIAASCGGGGGDDTSDSSPTSTDAATTTSTTASSTSSTAAPSTTSTTVPFVPRQPLTGEPLESEGQIIDRAALVVKIDNAPGARRNHSGLAVADIVFEEIVEGSITRFAAVFHSQGSDPIGPVRSGRTQDIAMLSSYNTPLFAWSGGNGGVTFLIDESSLINMSPSRATGYYRGNGSSPHNLYNNTDALWAQTPEFQLGPPGPQFSYLPEGAEFEGLPVGGAEVTMRGIDVRWVWNTETGKFDRWQEGNPHVDNAHGQIAATNVVVMGVDYIPSRVDNRSPEAQTVGEGPVLIFSNGQAIGGRWKRDHALFPPLYTDADGEVISIPPGNTWVELSEGFEPDGPLSFGVPVELIPVD